MEKIDFAKIRAENSRYAKDCPYDYCDRWCERCPAEMQSLCGVYMDELDCRLANIQDGKPEDDYGFLMEKYEKRFKALDEERSCDGYVIDVGEEEWESAVCEDRDLDAAAQSHPLTISTHIFMERAHAFLKQHYYEHAEEQRTAEEKTACEVLSFYHTLLAAKMYRAVVGMLVHRRADDAWGGHEVHDAVAQFDVCRKGILLSVEALDTLSRIDTVEVRNLRVILMNIIGRIVVWEQLLTADEAND